MCQSYCISLLFITTSIKQDPRGPASYLVQVTVQLAVRHTANSSGDVSRGDTPLTGATIAVQVPQGYALTSAPRQLTLYTSSRCEAPLVLHARRDVLPESLQCEATVLHTGVCVCVRNCYHSNC